MIQIELPCCGAIADLEPEAETVHCEECAIELLLAPDARPTQDAGHAVGDEATVDGASVPRSTRIVVLAA